MNDKNVIDIHKYFLEEVLTKLQSYIDTEFTMTLAFSYDDECDKKKLEKKTLEIFDNDYKRNSYCDIPFN